MLIKISLQVLIVGLLQTSLNYILLPIQFALSCHKTDLEPHAMSSTQQSSENLSILVVSYWTMNVTKWVHFLKMYKKLAHTLCFITTNEFLFRKVCFLPKNYQSLAPRGIMSVTIF